MSKYTETTTPAPDSSSPPALPANRVKRYKKKSDVEADPWCDPQNPKFVSYKDVQDAAAALRKIIPETPIVALAYYGQKLNVPVTVVLPEHVPASIEERCANYNASVIRQGYDMGEAKHQAFMLARVQGVCYLNGYDHPYAIAAAGSIGKEIMEQLPQTDAIIVPIGGGALIAGVAVAAKQMKTRVLIYGVESVKNCCFFKAMENEQPYKTAVSNNLANALNVPAAGYNAFHCARSHIDKMILVDDDLVTRALMHLVENERLVLQGAGAVSLAAILAVPSVVPELQGMTVVCLLTGGNMNISLIGNCLERAKTIEGRTVTLKVTLRPDVQKQRVLDVIANMGCNILTIEIDHALTDAEIFTDYLDLVVETRNLDHACQLRRVMDRVFPDMCEFLEPPESTVPCRCYPKMPYKILL